MSTELHPEGTLRSARWQAPAAWCVRRAGLSHLCAKTRGSPRTKIAIIDGSIETSHPNLKTARIEILEEYSKGTVGHSPAAAEHATFIASALAGNGPEVLGLCPRCPLLSIPAVDDDMLQGKISAAETARRLVGAIKLAVVNGATIIQISLEFGFGGGREGGWIAEALRAAACSGVIIILSAGGRTLGSQNPLLWVHGVIPVTATDRKGVPMYDMRWGVLMAVRGLSAPGADVPGAVLPEGVRLRSGSSFASCFVTATLALLTDAVPGATPREGAFALLGCAGNRSTSLTSAYPKPLDGDGTLRMMTQWKGQNNA